MSSSVAVKVEDYEAYYKKQKADSNCGFAEEFEVNKMTYKTKTFKDQCNLEKNKHTFFVCVCVCRN